MAPTSKHLRVNQVEESARYRAAVAEILRIIQVEHETTLLEIAEQIDVSLGTISNAANKKADLNASYLNRLGQAYGACCLEPYARLAGGRIVPIDHEPAEDVLPIVTKLAFGIASARTPSSPGGVSETLRQQLEIMPDLRSAYRALGALISQIEARREAA